MISEFNVYHDHYEFNINDLYCFIELCVTYINFISFGNIETDTYKILFVLNNRDNKRFFRI